MAIVVKEHNKTSDRKVELVDSQIMAEIVSKGRRLGKVMKKKTFKVKQKDFVKICDNYQQCQRVYLHIYKSLYNSWYSNNLHLEFLIRK